MSEVLFTLPRPTLEASIPVATLALVMAASAMSAVVMVPSKILDEVTAPAAMVGKAAVPERSPANCNFPLVTPSASGTSEFATWLSTYTFTAFCVGYKSLLVPSAVVVDLFTKASFKAKPGTVGAVAVPLKSPVN